MASNEGQVCACDDGYARNVDTQACEVCMESCATCLFTNVCKKCAPGYLEYRPTIYTSEESICLRSCPTGTEEVLDQCQLFDCLYLFFPLFLTSEIGGVYEGVELRGNNDPIPVYGRGFYIDN